MKITEVRLGRISVPLRTPFKTALRTVNSVEDVVVEIHTDTGAVGYGEAPPTGVITGDTTGAIIGAIRDHIAPNILGKEVDGNQQECQKTGIYKGKTLGTHGIVRAGQEFGKELQESEFGTKRPVGI